MFAAILFFSVSASAQIEGRVTDAKGKGVSKVTITATGADGTVASTTTTDEDGEYALDELAAGTYKVTAKATAAFQPVIRENVDVVEDETTTLDIALDAALVEPAPRPTPKSADTAQSKVLDTAMSSLERGFGSGDVEAIVAGIGADEKVMLEFPGLVDQRGSFGRDQAAYLLDGLFNKVGPTGFERVSVRAVRAEGQYEIGARWTCEDTTTKRRSDRDLYITLRLKDEKWSIVSIRSR